MSLIFPGYSLESCDSLTCLNVKIAKLVTEDCGRCVRIQVNTELWEEFSATIGTAPISMQISSKIVESDSCDESMYIVHGTVYHVKEDNNTGHTLCGVSCGGLLCTFESFGATGNTPPWMPYIVGDKVYITFGPAS